MAQNVIGIPNEKKTGKTGKLCCWSMGRGECPTIIITEGLYIRNYKKTENCTY